MELDKTTKLIVERLGSDAQRFSGKTVLLAGGAGFLGKHFLSVFQKLNESVLDAPCSVISVDNYITGSRYFDDKITHDPNTFRWLGSPTHHDAINKRC